MNELISVIVPIYKVEDYLDRCVESIVNQTYRNLEIILVDDGSPDGCPQKCDAWAERDGRVKVIHKENGGVSSARNAGLKAMTGKYVTFVDADDYLSPHFISYLYFALQEGNAQISVSGTRYCNVDEPNEKLPEAYNEKIAYKKYIVDRKFNICPLKYSNACWGILFDVKTIKEHSVSFHSEYCYGEDCLFFYEVFIHSKSLTHVKEELYIHTLNPNGASGSLWDEKRWSGIESCEEKLTVVEKYPKVFLYERIHYIGVCLFNLILLLKSHGDKKQIDYLYRSSKEKIFYLFWKTIFAHISLIDKLKLIKMLFSIDKRRQVNSLRREI